MHLEQYDVEWLTVLTSLTWLSLSGVYTDVVGDMLVETLAHKLKHLQSLQLGEEITAQALPAVGLLTDLRHLDLGVSNSKSHAAA